MQGFRVVARPEGRGPARSAPVALEAGKVAEATVEVGSGAAVSGRILDPDGRPLENAALDIYCGAPRFGLIQPEEWLENHCAGKSFELVTGKRFESEAGKEKADPLGGDGVYATTGADGRFRIDGLPEGKRRLVAVHPGFATGRLPVSLADGEETAAEVRLERGGAIYGFARLADGRPASGGVVVAAVRGAGGRFGTVDEHGRYRIEGLESGRYAVLLFESGDPKKALRNPGSLSLRSVSVEAPESVRFDLGPAPGGARLFGTVRRAGRPVSLASVTLRRLDGAGEGAHHALIWDGGGYAFEGVAPGRYGLEVANCSRAPNRGGSAASCGRGRARSAATSTSRPGRSQDGS